MPDLARRHGLAVDLVVDDPRAADAEGNLFGLHQLDLARESEAIARGDDTHAIAPAVQRHLGRIEPVADRRRMPLGEVLRGLQNGRGVDANENGANAAIHVHRHLRDHVSAKPHRGPHDAVTHRLLCGDGRTGCAVRAALGQPILGRGGRVAAKQAHRLPPWSRSISQDTASVPAPATPSASGMEMVAASSESAATTSRRPTRSSAVVISRCKTTPLTTPIQGRRTRRYVHGRQRRPWRPPGG